MRTLHTVFLAAACALFTSAAFAADTSPTDGVLIYKHQLTVADIEADPKATNVGQFFHDYPRGGPERIGMVPTKEVVTLMVRKANGEHVEITQDLADSKDLFVGDKVFIERVDGKDKVVHPN